MDAQPQPQIHKITNLNQLPGGGLYRVIQLAKEEQAKDYRAEGWLYESRIIPAIYLYIPVKAEA